DRHAVPAPAIEHPRTRLQLRQIEIENPPPRPLDFELQPFQMLARQRSRLIKPVVIRPLGEIDDAVIDGITARAVRTAANDVESNPAVRTDHVFGEGTSTLIGGARLSPVARSFVHGPGR